MNATLRIVVGLMVLVALTPDPALAQAAEAKAQPAEVKAQPAEARQAAETEESREQPREAEAEAVRLQAVFDASGQFVPPERLRLVERPVAEDAGQLAEAERGVSITPDGKVEEIALPEGIEDAFRELLRSREATTREEEMGSEEPVVRPESVIGDDTRVRVNNTTAFPYRTVGRIDIGCTGTFIGPRHILTAGHCVYNINTDKWYSNLNVTPGQNGNNKPYGTITWTKAISVQGWTKDHNRDYDYALIVLSSGNGNWMSFGYDNSLPKYNVNINGYPGDKGPPQFPVGTMWHSFGALKIIQSLRLYHDCDTFGGNSGSAVYVYLSAQNKRTIYGVHAYGVDGTGFNGATRITKARFDNLNKWISEN